MRKKNTCVFPLQHIPMALWMCSTAYAPYSCTQTRLLLHLICVCFTVAVFNECALHWTASIQLFLNARVQIAHSIRIRMYVRCVTRSFLCWTISAKCTTQITNWTIFFARIFINYFDGSNSENFRQPNWMDAAKKIGWQTVTCFQTTFNSYHSFETHSV